MVQEYAVDLLERRCECNYTVRKRDCFYVEQYDVWHLRCYNCGYEWVDDVVMEAEEE